MLKGIIINNSVEFNFAQSHVRENKSGEIFPQYYTSGFGEILPWRKFPAIRYYICVIASCPIVIKPTVKTEGPIAQKKAFERERTVEAPLPNPFPLPHHFPSTVEAGLIAQNPAVIPKYLSCVASSVLCHKLPERNMYKWQLKL